MISEW